MLNKKMAVTLAVAGIFCAGSLWAVKPTSVEVRQQAQKGKDKADKQKAKEQRATGCQYGKDSVTGKCYEPKQGQFYRDSSTGEVKVKKIEKVNLPWNQGTKK